MILWHCIVAMPTLPVLRSGRFITFTLQNDKEKSDARARDLACELANAVLAGFCGQVEARSSASRSHVTGVQSPLGLP